MVDAPFIHESSYVDEGVSLGVGTKVTGTLRMKVIPGKEKGKIVVYIDKK